MQYTKHQNFTRNLRRHELVALNNTLTASKCVIKGANFSNILQRRIDTGFSGLLINCEIFSPKFPAIAIGTHQEQFISVLRVVLEEVDLPVDQEEGDGLLWTAAVWHVLDKQLHLYIHRDTALQCSASPVHRDTQWHYNVQLHLYTGTHSGITMLWRQHLLTYSLHVFGYTHTVGHDNDPFLLPPFSSPLFPP